VSRGDHSHVSAALCGIFVFRHSRQQRLNLL
jgi:hypothetical protein